MNIVKVGCLSIFGLLAGCVALFLGGRFYYQTTKLDYCVQCHEMSTQYESFKTSFHYNEVVKNCQSCHIGKGVLGFVSDKATRDPKDWMEHLKKTYDSGEFIDISKGNLETVNENCLECHSQGYTKDATHLDMISMARRKVNEGTFKGLLCTDCHLGLVHPHMQADLFKAYAEKRVKPFGTYSDAECLGCHKLSTPAVVKDWTKGEHARQGTTCVNCHGNDHRTITKRGGIVPATTCATCHEKQFKEFVTSKHSQGTIVATMGKEPITTKALEQKECKVCHQLAAKFEWDSIGGTCNPCHTNHIFSTIESNESEACEKCHFGGPEHARLDVQEPSKHWLFYQLLRNRSGEKPNCQTCHRLEKTHDFCQLKLPEAVKQTHLSMAK